VVANWTIGGPVRLERRGLAFTPGRPCGTELDASGVELARLRTVATWSGQVGGSAPGDLVVVRGDVQARTLAAVAIGSTFTAFGSCEPQASSEPVVKLALASNGEGFTVIDSDTAVVMPAGCLVLNVLAPEDWRLLGRRDNIGPWTDVVLRVSVCPYRGDTPDGTLTEWFPFQGQDPIAQAARMMLRPRRAVGVEVSSQGPAALTVFGTNNADGTLPLASTLLQPLQVQYFERWGAPYMGIDANQQTTAHIRWVIR